jgi:cbb3-type cytochrome oxidase subunit 3
MTAFLQEAALAVICLAILGVTYWVCREEKPATGLEQAASYRPRRLP